MATLRTNGRPLGYVDFIRGRRTESRGFPFSSSELIADKWDSVLEASSVNWAPVGYLRNNQSFFLASGESFLLFGGFIGRASTARHPFTVTLYHITDPFHHFVFPRLLWGMWVMLCMWQRSHVLYMNTMLTCNTQGTVHYTCTYTNNWCYTNSHRELRVSKP